MNEEEIIDIIDISDMSEYEAILYLEHTAEDDFNLEEHQNHVRYLAIKTILQLYKKKSRMIEIMAEHLTTDTHGKDWVIKYFEDEVELEDEKC